MLTRSDIPLVKGKVRFEASCPGFTATIIVYIYIPITVRQNSQPPLLKAIAIDLRIKSHGQVSVTIWRTIMGDQKVGGEPARCIKMETARY